MITMAQIIHFEIGGPKSIK